MSRPAPRLLAVWVPDWPIVALTLEPRTPDTPDHATGPTGKDLPDPALTPLAVAGGHAVRAASAPARAAGVAADMPLRLARALCPELVVVPSSPQREARGFETVMQALDTLLADPLVARPGLALAVAVGPAAWAGGEEVLAEALVAAVAEGTGAECQVGVADSFLGAVLAAREGIVVAPGATPAFLAPHPLGVLLEALPQPHARRDAPELLETFARLGLRTLGDLAALPSRDVLARFGAAGRRLHDLARGACPEVPRQGRPRAAPSISVPLDPPAARSDAAAFAVRTAAEELVALLRSRGLVAANLRVEARCEDGIRLSRTWMLREAPTPAAVTDRVRWQLEGWLSGRSGRPPAAPLEHLRLTACDPTPAGRDGEGLWGRPGHHEERRALWAAERVESLLGAGGVLRPLLVSGRDPRSRVRLVAREEVPEADPGGAGPWAGSLPVPSPSVVPRSPLPASLLDAGGDDVPVDALGMLGAVPARVEVEPGGDGDGGWADAVVGTHPVVSWGGPWPVEEGWWRPEGVSRRAYLQVVTDVGPPLLLVRAGRWWLDAVYD